MANEEPDYEFNERFRELIKAKHLNASEASRLMDVSRQVVDGYLKRTVPRLSGIKQIVKAFPDLNIDWLITGSGQMINTGQKEPDCNQTELCKIANERLDLLYTMWREDRKELYECRERIKILVSKLESLTSI